MELEDVGEGRGGWTLQTSFFDGGDQLPVVVPFRGGRFSEHRCPKARSFSAANFNRKRR